MGGYYGHYYLTKDRITGYKTWLVREERAQATQEKYSRIVENFYCWLQGQAVTRETVNRVEKCTAAARVRTLDNQHDACGFEPAVCLFRMDGVSFQISESTAQDVP